MKSKGKQQNPTHAALKGTPFKLMSELKKEEGQVRYEVWKRLSEARVINELIEKEEFAFFRREFRAGIVLTFGTMNEVWVQVYSEGKGIHVKINNKVTTDASDPSHRLLEVLLKASTQSFGMLYYTALGIISPVNHAEGTAEIQTDFGSKKR